MFDIRDINRDGSVSPDCGGTFDELLYFDFDCDGFLSDDERDEDADGLTNYDESHGRMTPSTGRVATQARPPFAIPYAGTSMTDADSDNDGIRDGADDQDHDDVPNMMELSRMIASVNLAAQPDPRPYGHNETNGSSCVPLEGLNPKDPRHPGDYGKVQPFDPCDPAIWSRTCDRHPLLGGEPDPNWWSLN